ncbi:MAG: hypothetical protein U5K38_05465 [Woeseiaceae bacterium]|nr:hypothetical protein [Woeseiaceae bacterium]
MQSRQQIPVARRKARWYLTIVPLLGAVLAAPVTAQEIESIELEPVEPAAPRYAVELVLFCLLAMVWRQAGESVPDKVKGAEPDPVAAGDEDIAFGDRPMPGASSMRAEPGDEPRVEPGLEREGEYSAGTGVEPESGPTTLEPLLLPADIGLVVLPREKLTLSNAFDKLSELDAYRPVVWTGWTQTVYESDVTPVIRLRRLARIPLEFDGTLKLYLAAATCTWKST